jgi:flagella basal body P-ring formation protein FlgA
MNGRPLSMRKKIQILVALTLLAWATQTLFHQWGYGQEIPASAIDGQSTDAAAAGAEPAAYQAFVPRTITAGAGTVELRSDATVYGAEIKMKQVCRWSDHDAPAFTPVAELNVGRFEQSATSKTLSLDDIRGTLHDAGVNIAVIRFAGATTCRVIRGDAPGGDRAALQQWLDQNGGGGGGGGSTTAPTAARPTFADASPKPTLKASAPAAAQSASGIQTLHDRLMTDLSQRLNIPVDQLQVSFDPADDHLLNLAEPNFQFDIQPRRVRDLGNVSWDVSILAGSPTGARQKVQVTAQARAWQEQIVIGRPVSYRSVIRDEDVTNRRVLIDHVSDVAVLTRDQVVAQEAARDLSPGTIMTARLVEAVPLAKPGQYVTVTLTQGTVQLKTVAKAMEAGSFGQAIKVKNEGTKEIYEVTLTGPQTATMSAN